MKLPLQLVGLERGEVLTGPQSIHVDITNGCNTNCVTCWDHSPLLTLKRTRTWKRERVEVADVEALLDDVASLGGLRAIILSGMGEPFTHPRVYDLLVAVKSRGLFVTVITNLVAAKAERVLELDVDQLLIGIHGATEASYRAFHPSFRRDEWARLGSMLDVFQRAGRRYKHVQVICATNAHELVEMVELGARYGAAQINFKLAGLRHGTESARIDDAQRARLEGEWIGRAALRASELGVKTNLDVFAAQVRAGGEATAPIRDVGCFMGHTYARVLVDGTVLYCCNTDVRVGHLSEDRFSALWRGATWEALRARMRRGEYFDSCNQCGKLNQNEDARRRLEAAFGAARVRELTGARA